MHFLCELCGGDGGNLSELRWRTGSAPPAGEGGVGFAVAALCQRRNVAGLREEAGSSPVLDSISEKAFLADCSHFSERTSNAPREEILA
jgi:hypothetical protein